jgi:hypothetical protein
MVSWRVLIGGILMASAQVAVPVAADDTAGIASYEAVYQLDLWENTPSSAVESVNGKTFYSLTRGCDGWHSTEKYAINFLLSEGQSTEFVSVYDVWESHKGDSFSFNIKEDSSFDGKKSYEGFANLFTGYGEAQFFGDTDGSIELPSHTVFPQKHLTTLIKQAEAGSRVYQSHLFIGGEADDSQYFTSTLIGNAKEISMDIDMGRHSDDTLWPLRVAYFDPEANDAEPEYEIEFMIQPNGIIRSYVVDYGDFSMRAIMESFTTVNEESC